MNQRLFSISLAMDMEWRACVRAYFMLPDRIVSYQIVYPNDIMMKRRQKYAKKLHHSVCVPHDFMRASVYVGIDRERARVS